ncbi:MAG: PHP domain-containing protein [Clostridia bacterium]
MKKQTGGRGDFICPYANWISAEFSMKPIRAIDQYAADLHMHSTYSDGLMTPQQLCDMADQLGLTHVALCDHDTLDGLAEMQAAAAAIRERRTARGDAAPFVLLPSLELSSGRGGRTHILGYGADATNPALLKCLEEAMEDREHRAKQMLDLLSTQGVELPADVQEALINPHVGRAHIARALVYSGSVSTMQQAFDRYLAEGKCAYVPRSWLDTAKAVQTLKNAGAVVVLAHPMRLGLRDSALNALIEELTAFGLDGVEVFSPSANRASVRTLELLARRKGLLVTGGSDYHGDQGTRVRMGRLPSGWRLMREDVEALLTAMRRA